MLRIYEPKSGQLRTFVGLVISVSGVADARSQMSAFGVS